MKAFHVTLWEYAKNLIPFDVTAMGSKPTKYLLSTFDLKDQNPPQFVLE